MFNLIEVIGLMVLGAFLITGGVLLGAWIGFKFRNSVPGENFIGGVPDGEVFTMKDEIDGLDGEDIPAKKSMLARTEQFIKALGG
jgi:hypothetical protein